MRLNNKNLLLFKDGGLDGIAVISAILAQRNVGKATRDLYKLVKEILAKTVT